MAGLFNPGAPAPDAAPTPANDPQAPGAAADEPAQGTPATPEEEELNQEVVARALLVLYDKGFFPRVLDLLDVEDVKTALAETAAMICKRVYDSAVEAGMEIPGDVLMNAAKEVFEEVANVASQFRFIDFDADPQAFEGAFFLFMDKLRMLAQEAGDLDDEAIAADFQELAAQDGGAPAGPPANDPAPPAAPARAA